ncbi:hypothetical protein [Agrobacterium larrymoorei]|uniref:SGNH/GDSL hydrolase family protein n=1 Tax=Agrobacterium larrymoorei TaxID=160699 RepID=A0ABU0UMC7_9HYPH|nr:hypothetical protein [Agrobacterium larrymoorei]MDQ1186104.1 hypothetical protein [Agrobacterium larrymoorei]
MPLLTLGDSHALFCYAGVAGAKIYWRGPVTMHRAARDGIKSVVPGNFRPKKDDVVILSFGEIDCRAHIPKIASIRSSTTRIETLALCDRFEKAFAVFASKCPAQVAMSCIIPPPPIGLATEYYRSHDECMEDAIAIREMMNLRLSQMATFVDFRNDFVSENGQLRPDRWDGNVHIDSRFAQPVVNAVNSTIGTSFATTPPIWPHPMPMAQPPYISPIRKARRTIKRFVLSSLGLQTYPPETKS